MKILQSSFINYQRPLYPVMPYNKQTINQDTFVKSSDKNNLSFTGLEEPNEYQQILQNPTLAQKVMDLITTAAINIVAKATGTNIEQNDKNNPSNDIIRVIVEKEEKTTKEANKEYDLLKEKVERLEKEKQDYVSLKEELAQLRKENRFLSEMIKRQEQNPKSLEEKSPEVQNAAKKNNNEKSDNIKSTVEAEKPDLQENEGYKFEFPKKKAGILSKQQKDLKEITTSIKLDKKSGEKLTLICKTLITNRTQNINGQTVDNKDLTIDLTEKLKNSSEKEIPNVIDEFYKKCGLGNTSPDLKTPKSNETKSGEDKDIESKDSNNSHSEVTHANEKANKTELYKPSEQTPPRVTIIGKMDLDSIKEKKKNNNTKEAGSKDEKPVNTSVRPRIVPNRTNNVEQVPETEHTGQTSQIKIVDEKTNTFEFQIPGTPDRNVRKDLKRLLLQFEHEMQKTNPKQKFMYRQTLGVNVLEKDVLFEATKIPPHKKGAYKHINKNNVAEVTDAINADKRFNQMFTLHAAMRLIDRFAHFNSDEPLEDQCHNILDKLSTILQKSFKEGVEVEPYGEDTPNIGLSLNISPQIYDKGEKAIFGTFPIGLGICEYQPDPKYYNTHIKEPLICTIYSDGI